MNSLNNLAITATNGAMRSTIGALFNTLQSKIANGGRDRNCRFYYNDGAGGSIIQVAVKGAVGGAVSELKDEAVNAFNSLLNKKAKKRKEWGQKWVEEEQKKQAAELKEYGKMQVKGGVVYALDDWGCLCTDALMLGAKIDKDITITQQFPEYGNTNYITQSERKHNVNNVVTSDFLVWYDTTALITINSDKNLITTRVQGRDYSRKELVSNGDIKFSVSGQITSGKPDIYPTEEIKKFIKVMQYKGILKVNNQVLDQFGISHIVITNFNISPRQGYKSIQQYSFSAIGLQPENEIEISEDTITVVPQQEASENKKKDETEWMKMLNNQLDGLKSMASDIFSQGAGLAAGMLENRL